MSEDRPPGVPYPGDLPYGASDDVVGHALYELERAEMLVQIERAAGNDESPAQPEG